VDGAYIVKDYVVTEEEKAKSKTYLAHRMPTVEKLKFVQRWKLEKDEYCNGMEVLQPAELVFTGLIFKSKEELL
jgi:CRISPR type III-associated protein (TIGR04423 family)